MENASKALIIAGAILLSILLISLGIGVFRQAQDTIGSNGMSKAEINAFNSQFTKYEGTRKGSEVKALVQEVNTSNISDAQEQNGRSITIDGVNKSGETYSTSGIKSSVQYTVTIEYDGKTGYVNKITIK